MKKKLTLATTDFDRVLLTALAAAAIVLGCPSGRAQQRQLRERDKQKKEVERQLDEIDQQFDGDAKTEEGSDRPPVSAAEIKLYFVVFSDHDLSCNWWTEKMRDAKRNGLAECRVG